MDWFNKRKAAQVAAFFSNREGDEIAVLKLTKLIYLSDRQHMDSHGFPILNDKLVSMTHGPVNSITNNLVNGNIPCKDWDDFVSDRLEYCVGATKRFSEDDLDELSDAELTSLHAVWDRFGAMDKWEIRDWTHSNCPEWEDPNGGVSDIPYIRVFKFLNKQNAEELASNICEEQEMDRVFANLRA